MNELQSGKRTELDRLSCQFFYKTSIFKQSLNDRRTITQLTLRLLTEPNINIDYSALDVYFVSLDKDPTPLRFI